jgi:glycosyltransferase 2 family protein
VLWPIGAGILIFAIVAFVGDAGKVTSALAQFDWRLLPVALALTLSNYLLRWVRWQRYLRLFAIEVPAGESLAIFMGGLGMAITPGKLGEFVKAFLLQQQGRAPYAVVVPIVVAERLADGIAMALLALIGIASLGQGPVGILLPVLPAVALVILVRWRGAADWTFDRAADLPLVGRLTERGRGYYESAYTLFGATTLLMAIGIGVISWFAEAVALVVILGGLGVPHGDGLLLQATGAMAIATLVGTLSFLPGGLGLAEGGLVGLLLLFVPGIELAQAAAATMLFRLVTFWFGVSLGVLTLTWLLRRLGAGVPPTATNVMR